jgi:hypothetical protein
MNAAIGTVSELVTVLRSRLTVGGATAPGSDRRANARPGEGRRYADRSLSSLIETRIRQIGQDDPQRGRKAFRVFLELVLLTQLGEELMNDPKFYQLLDDVQGALESDASAAALVKQAMEHLLSHQADATPTRRSPL